MRRFLLYALMLVLAILLGLAIYVDSGYVLLAYHHWTVEMPLWFALVVLVLVFTVGYIGLGVVRAVRSIQRRVAFWKERRRLVRAKANIEKSFILLLNSDWKRMEKLLVRGAKKSAMPWIQYLGAAFAAQQQGHDKCRTNYIRKAYAASPGERLTIGLMQAKLQLEHQQFELARATLKHLQQIAPHHASVFHLLKKLYITLQDWSALQKLLPTLQRYMDKPAFQVLQAEVYQYLLSAACDNETHLSALWDQVPRRLRMHPALLQPYCRHLLQFGRHQEVAQLIEDALAHQWDDGLLRVYGNIQFAHPAKHLQWAERWMRTHRYHALLLLVLAKIAMQCKHWAKVKEYCIASLQVEDSAEAHALLGQVYAYNGETTKALQAYAHIDWSDLCSS